jgi:hypothetical protein
MHQELCKNCTHIYQGKFCPNCGQKAATHEIDFNFVMHEVPHSAFHLSKGIFFTIKELCIRPGKTIKDYFEGKRINHFPPLTYLLIITSLFVFVKSLQIAFSFREIKKENTSELNQFIDKNFILVLLIMIPVYALVYKLFHLKFKYNYWQLLVAQTFIIGHIFLIMLIPQLVFFFFPETRNLFKGYFLLITAVFQIFTYYQLFNDSRTIKIRLLIRELICYAVATIIAIVFTVFLLGVITEITKFMHH